MLFDYVLTKITKMRKTENIKCQDTEQPQLSHNESVKWYKFFGKQFGNFLHSEMYIYPSDQFHTEVLFQEKAALFKIAQTANNLNMYQHLSG